MAQPTVLPGTALLILVGDSASQKVLQLRVVKRQIHSRFFASTSDSDPVAMTPQPQHGEIEGRSIYIGAGLWLGVMATEIIQHGMIGR